MYSFNETNDQLDTLNQLILSVIEKHAPFVKTKSLVKTKSKSKTWFINDQSSKEGTQLESLTSLYGMTQLIAEPTHVLENSSSCIDLIFTNQPNLIMDSGVYPSLHSKCHHQVIYTKLNLQKEYPPPYTREV